jgi:outer membrane protein OmpA-like peptidoglycan-associated protein
MGIITITESHVGQSIGNFTVNDDVLDDPIVRIKVARKGDFLVPRLILDSSLLFDLGSDELKPGVLQEFLNVANFIRFHKPSKLIIEGHTDGDGDQDYNQALSERRTRGANAAIDS